MDHVRVPREFQWQHQRSILGHFCPLKGFKWLIPLAQFGSCKKHAEGPAPDQYILIKPNIYLVCNLIALFALGIDKHSEIDIVIVIETCGQIHIEIGSVIRPEIFEKKYFPGSAF